MEIPVEQCICGEQRVAVAGYSEWPMPTEADRAAFAAAHFQLRRCGEGGPTGIGCGGIIATWEGDAPFISVTPPGTPAPAGRTTTA